MLKIKLDDKSFQLAVQGIAEKLKNPRVLYGALGETLKKIHTQRFKDEKSPDGSRWKPLASSTIRQKTRKGKSLKILRQDGYLSDQLAYNYSSDSLEFGSSRKYARIHHFGGKAGRGHKVNIPARPWLGINSQDRTDLENKAHYLLQKQIERISR